MNKELMILDLSALPKNALGLKINMIKIKETKRCDTRSIEKNFTENDVLVDTIAHKESVVSVGKFLTDKLNRQFSYHDYTKIGKYLPLFTRALKTKFVDDDFYNLNWWKLHITKERHHLNDRCPDDVNLIDVLEMLADCVCAGLARTGKVYKITIPTDILERAVENTVQLLINNIEVEKEGK